MTAASDLGIVGDGTTDNTPAMETAMADAALTSIEFGPGHFRFNSQVDIRSGMSIRGVGQGTRISPLTTFAPRTAMNNALWATVPYSENISVSDILFDGMSIGVGATSTRICGLVPQRSKNFRGARGMSKAFSGYGVWFSGDGAADINERACSGIVEDWHAEDCNVLYEASVCRGVTFRRITGTSGAETVSMEAAFHPLNGAEQVTFEDFIFTGKGGSGITCLALGRPVKDVEFRRGRIELTNAATAFVSGPAPGSPTTLRVGVTVEDCDFESPTYNCAVMVQTDAIMRRCNLRGLNVCTGTQAGTIAYFEDVEMLASNDPSSASIAHALRLEAGSAVTMERGALRARGHTPVAYIKNSAATLNLSPDTILEP